MRRNDLLGRVPAHLALALVALSGVAAGAAERAARQPTPAAMVPLAAQAMLTDVTFADGGLVAVGERGHIVLSDDGEHWRQVPSPVDDMLTAVSFVDDRHGWAVGHAATVLHTADGGESWSLQHYDPGEQQTFLDVLFVDPSRGYAVGAFGLYMSTDDGGETWEPGAVVGEQEFDIPHLNDIARTDDGGLAIAAEFGLFFRSDDDGETWQKFETPYEGSYFTVLHPAPGSTVVGGLRGQVFRSDDGGASWTALHIGLEDSLYGGTVLEGGEIVLVGQNAAVVAFAPDFSSMNVFKLDSGNTLADVVELPDGDLLVTDKEGAHRVPRSNVLP